MESVPVGGASEVPEKKQAFTRTWSSATFLEHEHPPEGGAMTKVGLITVGQSPRSDVVPDMAAILGGDVEIVEAGALDGLDGERIAALAPQGDDEILVTRLSDGSPVFVGKTGMIPLIEARIAAL